MIFRWRQIVPNVFWSIHFVKYISVRIRFYIQKRRVLKKQKVPLILINAFCEIFLCEKQILNSKTKSFEKTKSPCFAFKYWFFFDFDQFILSNIALWKSNFEFKNEEFWKNKKCRVYPLNVDFRFDLDQFILSNISLCNSDFKCKTKSFEKPTIAVFCL